MTVSVLVRVWDGFQDEVASGWVDWDPNGGFVLPHTDPMARLLFHTAHLGSLRLTVYSTEELLWSVRQVEVCRGEATVHCKPFLEELRNSLASDEYLVFVWLDAERRWQESLI